MFTNKRIIGFLAVLLLAGCSSGGDDNSFGTPPVVITDPDTEQPIVVNSIEALTSNPQIQSDGGIPVTISALVKDENNNFVENALVQFATNSGGLQATTEDRTTGADGVATAILSTAGNPANRVITVTASVAALNDTVDVTVIGTSLQVNGPASLAQGATGTYTLILNNANGIGIDGESIAVASTLGNTISATTLTTDSAGQAQFDYTAVNGGNDTITANGLGEAASTNVSISSDSFAFVSPAVGTEINLGATQAVTLQWSQNNTPVAGQSISFAATRGTITPSTVVTNASGQASATVTANNAGFSTITGTTVGGPTASLEVEFIATTPNTIEVQADPFVVDPNSQSAITAIVRDIDNNLVKNVNVIFDLVDVTGGGLSAPSSLTDSQGRAQTFYTSSSQTSSTDGVLISASVDGTAIQDSVNLTVAGREVFLSFGTGNEIFEPNPVQYRKPYVVQVTDASGRAVTDAQVAMSVLSVRYFKGVWCGFQDANSYIAITQSSCFDEDVDRDGVLDPNEDINNNGRIEAGNIATVTPGNFTTDANGFGFIDLFYPQEYGAWVEVELQARTSVQGTEFFERSVFVLPVAADDVNDLEIAPPGLPYNVNDLTTIPAQCDPNNLSTVGVLSSLASPFGFNPNCAIDDFN